MGNNLSGNCYKAENEKGNFTDVAITSMPPSNPVNITSTINKNIPQHIGKVNFDFSQNENESSQEIDPLSQKDSLARIKEDLQKKKQKKDVVFKGNFLNDQFEGEGVFQFKNGDWFKGINFPYYLFYIIFFSKYFIRIFLINLKVLL